MNKWYEMWPANTKSTSKSYETGFNIFHAWKFDVHITDKIS